MYLIRNRQLLTRGLKGTPSTQLGVRILSPLYIPRQLPQSTCLHAKFKNAHIQGCFLRRTSACFTSPASYLAVLLLSNLSSPICSPIFSAVFSPISLIPLSSSKTFLSTLNICIRVYRTPDVSLTKSKLDSFKKGLDTNSLYPMLIEAIHAAHSLGIKYLWVDYLCIYLD